MRTLVLVGAIALLVGVLPAAAANPEPQSIAIGFSLPPDHLVPGQVHVLTLKAVDADGAPAAGVQLRLLPSGTAAVTNHDGLAHFRLSESGAGRIDYTITRGATPVANFTITWSTIEWTATTSRAVTTVGTPHLLTLQAVWAVDEVPVPGVQAFAWSAGTMYPSAPTDRTGGTTIQLVETWETHRSVEVSGDGWTGSTRLELAWQADVPPNRPPTLEGVRIVIDGREARAEAGSTSDPDGDPVTVLHSWRIDGVPLSGSISSVSAPPGAHLHVTSSPFDGHHFGPARSAELVVPANLAPSPHIEVQAEGNATFVLTADASTDPEGDALAYEWRLDDGRVVRGSHLLLENVTAPLAVELQVTDAYGAKASAVARVDPAALSPASDTGSAADPGAGVDEGASSAEEAPAAGGAAGNASTRPNAGGTGANLTHNTTGEEEGAPASGHLAPPLAAEDRLQDEEPLELTRKVTPSSPTKPAFAVPGPTAAMLFAAVGAGAWAMASRQR